MEKSIDWLLRPWVVDSFYQLTLHCWSFILNLLPIAHWYSPCLDRSKLVFDLQGLEATVQARLRKVLKILQIFCCWHCWRWGNTKMLGCRYTFLMSKKVRHFWRVGQLCALIWLFCRKSQSWSGLRMFFRVRWVTLECLQHCLCNFFEGRYRNLGRCWGGDWSRGRACRIWDQGLLMPPYN